MTLFTSYPTYNPYRSVYDRTPNPLIKGEDVYALQDALNAVTNAGLTLDGVCGPRTGAAIWAAQKQLGVIQDGKAGGQTQAALAMELIHRNPGIDIDLTFGQLQHESSLLLGNKSGLRPDGTYDAGVAQMNTGHYSAKDGFTPTVAIALLARQTTDAYSLYANTALYRGDDHSDFRRMQLAAGHWNAPAFANYFAGVRPWATPSPQDAATFEAYMDDATAYLGP